MWRAGAYCCATLTKDRRFRTLSLRPGLVPVTYPDGKIKIKEIKGANNPANFMTKAVGGAAFARDRAYALGMR